MCLYICMFVYLFVCVFVFVSPLQMPTHKTSRQCGGLPQVCICCMCNKGLPLCTYISVFVNVGEIWEICFNSMKCYQYLNINKTSVSFISTSQKIRMAISWKGAIRVPLVAKQQRGPWTSSSIYNSIIR